MCYEMNTFLHSKDIAMSKMTLDLNFASQLRCYSETQHIYKHQYTGVKLQHSQCQSNPTKVQIVLLPIIP